ncbi:hypothetical protein OSTOST_01789 [Ostertagia ostertagi]
MSASFPVPAPGPFNAQSPVFPQGFAFPADAYQQGFNTPSNPYPSSNGAIPTNPMFDAKQMNGYGYVGGPGPMGGAPLMSPTANVPPPFGTHPMRQFHQPGMPKPGVYPSNAMRPPSNGSGHPKSDSSPASMQQPSSDQMRNPALQMYYKRRKTLLVLPYPAGPNLPNIAPMEPATFAFLPHTKHYDVAYDRRYPTMNPMSQGQPQMQNRQPAPSPQMMSPAFTQPQPPTKSKAPPTKKARSGCMTGPPRHMQPMPPDMSHYGGVPTSQMGMNPAGMPYYPGMSPNTVPTSSSASAGGGPSMGMPNGMYPMGNVPHSAAASMNMARLQDMSQQVNDNRSQQVPVSGVYQNMSNGQMSSGDQQSLSSPRNQMTQNPYQQSGNQFDISPQCPKCLCLVSPTNRSVQCNGPCMRLFHQNCTGLLPRAFALLEEDPSAKWVCGACESSVL